MQTEVFTLQNVANNFEMEISSEQSEMLAFSGQDPVRCKITVDNKFVTIKKHFKYLCCDASYENVIRYPTSSKIFSNTGNSKYQF